MKQKLLILLTLIICNGSTAQDISKMGDNVLVNPVRWGTIVYVEASNATKSRLLSEFRATIVQPNHHCNTQYDEYENWYCDNEPELIFRALNGYGEKEEEAMLCPDYKILNAYKYLNAELFIFYGCLVASWDLETPTYQFHTIKDRFGEECE